MRQFFEGYNMVIAIAAAGCLTIGMKSIAAIIYYGLIRNSEQMGSTKNKRIKSFIAKFEAIYKLRMEVHNAQCRVESFLYNMRVMGISLYGWKNMGLYGCAVITLMFGTDIVAGINYGMSNRWFMVSGLTYAAAVILIASSELVLQLRRKDRQLYVQMLDYVENTLKTHLEKEYIRKEETKAYQMEYFEPEDEKDFEGENEGSKDEDLINEENDNQAVPYESVEGNNKGVQKEAASTLENLRLLEEFIEQL